VRTAEDVKKVIEHAKLSENDLKPNVQPLYFGEKFENYKLLQLDEHILEDLKCGQTYDLIQINIINIQNLFVYFSITAKVPIIINNTKYSLYYVKTVTTVGTFLFYWTPLFLVIFWGDLVVFSMKKIMVKSEFGVRT